MKSRRRKRCFIVPVFDATTKQWLGGISFYRRGTNRTLLEQHAKFEDEIELDELWDFEEEMGLDLLSGWYGFHNGELCIFVERFR